MAYEHLILYVIQISDMKLVDGTSPCNGRLQVLHKGQWGSVCNTGWGQEDATVLCHELDCGEADQTMFYVGPFAGSIWMDNLECTENELSLWNCPFTGSGVSSCRDGLYAGVVCNRKIQCGFEFDIQTVFKKKV